MNFDQKKTLWVIFRFMKMRQENSESAQERKKQKSTEDFEGDIDDNESIESVSDDEFDKYLGKLTLH
jgi:hypothetical protein